MSNIAADARKLLNQGGAPHSLQFEVSKLVRKEGGWTEIFFKSNVSKQNRIAEQVIVSDVEEDLTSQYSTEVLLVPAKDILDPVNACDDVDATHAAWKFVEYLGGVACARAKARLDAIHYSRGREAKGRRSLGFVRKLFK